MPSRGPGVGGRAHASVPEELSSEASLLSFLGMSPAELKKIWYFRNKMYENFTIPSKSGKPRAINAPNQRLLFIQSQIALQLNKLYYRRNPVHGYVAGRSVKTNASAHLKQKYVLNLDAKDFFPSIKETRVDGVLRAIGIPDRVATLVARICCIDGHLPQGGPASPVLSNMVCFRLDRTLLQIAKEARCIYTRYADDITLSGLRPLAAMFEGAPPGSGPVAPELLSTALRAAFDSNGFSLNSGKIHYADKHSRRVVTGIKVNQGLNVDRRFVRNIRAALYSVEMDTVAAQKRFVDDFGGSAGIADHLKGKIAWLGHVKGHTDPVYRSLARRFNNTFVLMPIKVQPTRTEKLDRSVWVVEQNLDDAEKYRQGSAFFLNEVGLVTAAHCVDGAKEAFVHHPSKPANKFRVEVDKISKHRDIALLSHQIPENEYYILIKSKAPITTGDPVIAIGYPEFGPADRVNFRSGMISSTTVRSMISLFEVNFKLTQGMSGGPIVDKNDEVVGIVHKGGPLEGRDFAIFIDEMEKWAAGGFE